MNNGNRIGDMRIRLFLIALLFAITSCSPRITSNLLRTYEPEGTVNDVVLLGEKEPTPADAEWIGSIEVKGKGSYDSMAQETRLEAWRAGGKFFRVKSFASDGVRSDIHIMNSDIYRLDTVQAVSKPMIVGNSNGYESAAGSAGDMTLETIPSIAGNNALRFFVGYGRRLNKLSPNLGNFEKIHYKRLMNGVLLGGELIYYYDDNGSGLGLRYQVMRSSTSDAVSITYDDGSYKDGLWDEKVTISFIGPLYSGRAVSKNGKHLFMSNVGAGLLMYNDIQAVDNEELTVAGKTFGITGDINYSYMLNDHFSIGADVSYTNGVIKRVTISDGTRTESFDLDENSREGLLHLGVCLQAVYTF